MKITKYLMAGVAAVALAGVAHADVTINITGSTAFRASIHSSILSIMSGENYAYTGGTLGGANQAIFVGTVSGITGTTTIRTSWSGSAQGVQSVAEGSNVNFLPTSTTVSGSGTANTTPGTDPAVAKFALSDVYQSSTLFTTPTLQNTDIAVVPFVFVANDGAPSDLTNMTAQQFRALFGSGFLPLSILTGDVADNATYVYPTGRDGGSGTRITTLAETGYGIFTLVQQWNVSISGVNGSINSIRLWPTTGSGADLVNAGNGGYTSGSGVRDALGCTSTSVDTFDADNNPINTDESLLLIGYLGVADAATAVANGAKELTYEGIAYSQANVEQGAYTFWGYQHFLNASGLSADETTFKTALTNNVISNPGSAGIALGGMTVSRTADGGLVGPL